MSGTFCIEFVFKNMEILPNPTESLNNREIIVTIFVIDKFRLYECFQDKFQHGRISADSAVLFRRQTFSDMRQIMNDISREDSHSYCSGNFRASAKLLTSLLIALTCGSLSLFFVVSKDVFDIADDE